MDTPNNSLTNADANLAPETIAPAFTSEEEALEYYALLWEEKQDYFHLRYNY